MIGVCVGGGGGGLGWGRRGACIDRGVAGVRQDRPTQATQPPQPPCLQPPNHHDSNHPTAPQSPGRLHERRRPQLLAQRAQELLDLPAGQHPVAAAARGRLRPHDQVPARGSVQRWVAFSFIISCCWVGLGRSRGGWGGLSLTMVWLGGDGDGGPPAWQIAGRPASCRCSGSRSHPPA
jgi:hypothetical protein